MTRPLMTTGDFLPLGVQTLAKALHATMALTGQHLLRYFDTLGEGEVKTLHLEGLRALAQRGRDECLLLAHDPSYTTDWNDPQRIVDIVNLFAMSIAAGEQQREELTQLWALLESLGEGK